MSPFGKRIGARSTVHGPKGISDTSRQAPSAVLETVELERIIQKREDKEAAAKHHTQNILQRHEIDLQTSPERIKEKETA
jgi:hypothetical protein